LASRKRQEAIKDAYFGGLAKKRREQKNSPVIRVIKQIPKAQTRVERLTVEEVKPNTKETVT
jgi:hypothetical protein